ncbi:unnamed protein product [Cuscuta europaea]|uniref:Mitochondrial fission protein ELM1 n=1 Tax=Cuscuta europaea TaxID=41803 RepID=A0A9P0VLZ5_CUSEU|nr:unnamed protein product [Cuscuta europaea]
MKPIRLPELPQSPQAMGGMPDIFEAGVYGVIRRAVIIGNGFPASENQSIGLVRALGLLEKHTLYRVTRPRGGINEWLHWLPVFIHKRIYYILNLICGYSHLLLGVMDNKLVSLPKEDGTVGLSLVLEADVKNIVNFAKESFEKDGPLLVVASGKDTISIASSIKRLASESVFVVQIQHPRSHLDRFDLVITPKHDYCKANEQAPRFLRWWITPNGPPDKHVILTVGALHQVDSTALRAAANSWHDKFSPLPKPLLVVNIGGPSRYCKYGIDLATHLITSLHNILERCGIIRICFSRRTPAKISKVIIKELGTNPQVYIWDGEDPNPHMGHLAWADSFVITADSVSMLSEACSTGKPVYVVGAEYCRGKILEFHKALSKKGLVRPFTGHVDMSKTWSYPPLNDTTEAANRVNEALLQRGWKIKV